MYNNLKLTDKELDSLLKNNLVILIDNREKKDKNTHITDWLDYKNRCQYMNMTLPTGDYSVMLRASPEVGIHQDLYFYNEIAIERKANLEELSNNFTTKRSAFESEMLRALSTKLKLIVAIEDTRSRLYLGEYDTKYNRRSFIASIATFENRYNVPFQFAIKEEMPVYIYTTLCYYVRERLK
jgi:hypothetical protein